MKKRDAQLSNNWIKSIAVNTVILILIMVFTHMCYETNDDYAIASRIADGCPEVLFVSYYLCRLLVSAGALAPALNLYILLQIALGYVSFVVMLKLMLDRNNKVLFTIAASAVIAVFSFDHYCMLQFSKTSIVAALAGFMIIADAVLLKRGAGYYIAGIVLVFAGAAFRIEHAVFPSSR